jgi:hypothetical protein
MTDYDQRLLIGGRTMTGEEYAAKMEEAIKEEYVILVAQIVDTAMIMATSPQEAANTYEFPPGAENLDLAVWAMTRAEFDEMVKAEAGQK